MYNFNDAIPDSLSQRFIDEFGVWYRIKTTGQVNGNPLVTLQCRAGAVVVRRDGGKVYVTKNDEKEELWGEM